MSAVRFLLLLCLCLNSPFSLSVSDSESLLAVKKAFSNTKSLDSWKPDSEPCKDHWTGVFCLDGKNIIIRLHLPAAGLSGDIDVNALSQIRSLRTISLINNSFAGPLPPFNKINGLRALYLSGNKFSGEIQPDLFSGLGSLRRLWLSYNNFSGKIPDSLSKLPKLQQLHMESNRFSGLIPDISQKSITELDFSNNKLEGEIPAGMSRFGTNAFKGNAGVCGKLIGTDCHTSKEIEKTSDKGAQSAPADQTSDSSAKTGGNTKTTVGVMVGIVVVMVVILLLTTALKSKHKDDDFGMLQKEPMNDMVEVHVHGGGITAAGNGGGGGSRKSVGSSYRKKEESSSRKRSQSGKGGLGDLVVINNDLGVFGLADLMKAAAEVLGNGGLGSAYKAMMANGVSVVVKRIRDMNRLGKEDFDAEIRRIGSLRHPNILTPLAYYYRKEEKLVVSEYIPKGSLLYVLHGDRGICYAELNWPTRLKIIKGIASGTHHLHSEFSFSKLPHGNIKSSNILLNDEYEPLLTDYGFFSFVNGNQAAQGMFAFKAPEAAASENQRQVSHKSDVYCLGIVILEILMGRFPSQYLSAGKGGTDVVHCVRMGIEEKNEAEYLDPEIASGTESIREMVQLLHVGAGCTNSDPDQRPSMEEVVKKIEEIRA
ncbi:hypothetical protein Nepgr_019959 [Nepenthes gracilis]|uniref:Protein kinase domain-containing protein n=1 Tax=Nepenthes gracilis TaxID=150966 RepID=A0AAD3XUV1_NEPGR|nr:hypothetical protein Nepgr_019959 [Nepenthes gracilis]